MTRGTTPLHTFVFPEQVLHYKNILITYRQNNGTVLQKSMNDAEIDENKLKLRLTEAETLKFDSGVKAFVQVKVLTTDDLVEASAIYSFPVNSILDESSMLPVDEDNITF